MGEQWTAILIDGKASAVSFDGLNRSQLLDLFDAWTSDQRIVERTIKLIGFHNGRVFYDGEWKLSHLRQLGLDQFESWLSSWREVP